LRLLALLLVVLPAGVPGCAREPELGGPTPLGPSASAVAVTDAVTGAAIGNPTITREGSRVTVEAAGYLTRETSAAATVDLIPAAAPFDLAYYRALVRNAADAPASLEPLRRQQTVPKFYIRTIDEAGAHVAPALVDLVAGIVGNVEGYTGGRFTTTTVERGTHDGRPGWITIKWLVDGAADICGWSPLGGSWIAFNYRNPNCACNGLAISAHIVRHELGHAMGFYHSGVPDEVMSGTKGASCGVTLSARERLHMALAYARPVGNRDLDVDPSGSSMGMRDVVAID
jgi:hypothetical protein